MLDLVDELHKKVQMKERKSTDTASFKTLCGITPIDYRYGEETVIALFT